MTGLPRMRTCAAIVFAVSISACADRCVAQGRVVFETTSPYHHIRVIDQQGLRTLSFDGSMETRMSLKDPLTGHFEYIEYFHTPWLWNSNLTNVLMIGLGGASVQRAYEHYYPQVSVETAEIDATVARIAKEYFGLKESPRQRIHVADGRVHLRRTETKYDAIILDAYVKNRYGSFIPYHLVTAEFFKLAKEHLTTNGVVAYNVIGQQRANALIQNRQVTLPTFRSRVLAFRADPPANFQRCSVLTDDFAPVDGLLSKGGR